MNNYTLSYRFLYGNDQGCVFCKNRPVSLNWSDYTYFALVKVAKQSILSLHGFQGARTAFSMSALKRDIVFLCRPTYWLPLYNLIKVNSESFMASSSRTIKIACAVTRILYRVHGSNLSGLRSRSLPIRYFCSLVKA